jgi:hypothetical protein
MSAAEVVHWKFVRSGEFKLTLTRSTEALIKEVKPRWVVVKRDGLKLTLKRSTEALDIDTTQDASPKKKRALDKNH